MQNNSDCLECRLNRRNGCSGLYQTCHLCSPFKVGINDGQADVQVVTAFVMVSQQMDAELALKYVQMKHPPAWPNQGFRYQLKLFEDMGCKLVCNAPPPPLFHASYAAPPLEFRLDG